MPKFVIQQHKKQGEPVHWDLMLEEGDSLKTYRLDKPPEKLMTETATATPIFDHEKRFLTYEGPVNKGLGQVQIEERGTYQTRSKTEHIWHMTLQGDILQGRFTIATESNDRCSFGRGY
ncbi:DNA polymerase ligase N-terminal domain-containing protein [Planctomycetota bacterium]